MLTLSVSGYCCWDNDDKWFITMFDENTLGKYILMDKQFQQF